MKSKGEQRIFFDDDPEATTTTRSAVLDDTGSFTARVYLLVCVYILYARSANECHYTPFSSSYPLSLCLLFGPLSSPSPSFSTSLSSPPSLSFCLLSPFVFLPPPLLPSFFPLFLSPLPSPPLPSSLPLLPLSQNGITDSYSPLMLVAEVQQHEIAQQSSPGNGAPAINNLDFIIRQPPSATTMVCTHTYCGVPELVGQGFSELVGQGSLIEALTVTVMYVYKEHIEHTAACVTVLLLFQVYLPNNCGPERVCETDFALIFNHVQYLPDRSECHLPPPTHLLLLSPSPLPLSLLFLPLLSPSPSSYLSSLLCLLQGAKL